MPHPKRKHSKQRRDKRRTHDNAIAPTLSSCSNCGATVQYARRGDQGPRLSTLLQVLSRAGESVKQCAPVHHWVVLVNFLGFVADVDVSLRAVVVVIVIVARTRGWRNRSLRSAQCIDVPLVPQLVIVGSRPRSLTCRCKRADRPNVAECADVAPHVRYKLSCPAHVRHRFINDVLFNG